MADYTKKVHCALCGKLLFTERERNNKFQIISHSKAGWRHLGYSQKCICVNCYEKRENDWKVFIEMQEASNLPLPI